MDDHYPQRVFYNRPQIACPALSDGLCPARRSRAGSRNLRINFLPSHSAEAFGSQRTPSTKRRVIPVLPSRLLPAFTGRDFITTTDSSATSHRIVRPWVSPCAFLTRSIDQWIETIRGFPSYLWLPVKLPHPQSRYGSTTRYRASRYVARLPTRCAESGSLALCAASLPIASFRPCRCQQRPCDSDCLPPDQGDVCILQQAGFASSAGQTAKSPCLKRDGAFLNNFGGDLLSHTVAHAVSSAQ